MKRLVGSAAVLLLSLTAACASGGVSGTPGDGGTPPATHDEALTPAQAETAFNDAVIAALAPNSGVTVVETHNQATLDGSLTADGAQVTFTNLVLAKRPFAATGAATVANASHSLSITFANSTLGSLDGSDDAIHAKIPMTNSFVQATAGWAMNQAWHPGFAAGPCNVTVADDGAGGVLIDGSCTVCNATVTFTQLDINFSSGALSITGTIDVDDGNGNTATLTFAGTTVDVVVNGQDLGTFDLSQIFGGP